MYLLQTYLNIFCFPLPGSGSLNQEYFLSHLIARSLGYRLLIGVLTELLSSWLPMSTLRAYDMHFVFGICGLLDRISLLRTENPSLSYGHTLPSTHLPHCRRHQRETRNPEPYRGLLLSVPR